MKKIPCFCGILVVLSLTTLIAQDEETDLFANKPGAEPESTRIESLSAASREKLGRLVFQDKAAHRWATKRVVLSGPLISLFKSNDRVQTFNPFALSNSGARWTPARLDPYLPHPRGFVLFRVEF